MTRAAPLRPRVRKLTNMPGFRASSAVRRHHSPRRKAFGHYRAANISKPPERHRAAFFIEFRNGYRGAASVPQRIVDGRQQFSK
jgi:hypothetical protein